MGFFKNINSDVVEIKIEDFMYDTYHIYDAPFSSLAGLYEIKIEDKDICFEIVPWGKAYTFPCKQCAFHDHRNCKLRIEANRYCRSTGGYGRHDPCKCGSKIWFKPIANI